MKNTGIFKAMKLCIDYEKMSEDKKQEIRNQRLREIVNYAKENSPYFKKLYGEVPENFELTDLPSQRIVLFIFTTP